jgi:hypothetical protein
VRKSWIYTIIALIAASIAVVFAYLAGKQSDELPEDPEPDPDDQDKKNDQDGKE